MRNLSKSIQIQCKLCSKNTSNELGGACRACIDNMFSDKGASIILVGKLLEYTTATLKRFEASEELIPNRDIHGNRRYTRDAITNFLHTRSEQYFNKLLHKSISYDYLDNEFFSTTYRENMTCSKCQENPAIDKGYCAPCLDDLISKAKAAEIIGCSPVKLGRLVNIYVDDLKIYPFGNQVRLSLEEVLIFNVTRPDAKKIKSKWSNHALKCRLCKTTEKPHYGGGYCADCYKNSKEFTIMNGYMSGENLSELGEAVGVTRERARQLFEKSIKIETERIDPDKPQISAYELREHLKNIHKRNRAKRDYKEIIESNYDSILEQISGTNVVGEKSLLKVLDMPESVIPFIKQKYPEFIEIVNSNSSRWSWKYDQCRMCGTTDIKHKRWGYCENCFTKSDEWKETQNQYRQSHLEEHRARTRAYSATYTKRPEVRERLKQRTHMKNFDGNREEAFRIHGAKCYDCGILRAEYLTNNLKDLAVYHADGNPDNNDVTNLRPLCFSCLAKRVKS